MIHVELHLPIRNDEVPSLREAVGWSRRDDDSPLLFQRCNFWAGARDTDGTLIAFGYMTGMGLEHGYIEDIIVHPTYQRQGIGQQIVKRLLDEAQFRSMEIVTVTYSHQHEAFYTQCGLLPSHAGIWRA
ncbi:GNAT family N-acetyltransferase [Paenibacillus wenxiniae]|uniref:GNAT family N-acetyltransferase n=1 Tax=Paenibacillus wenxiniae TaxID=1636843 RepID=A0ABW4RNH4_9BACL